MADEIIELRDGPTLPVDVLRLAWALENRGLILSQNPVGVLRLTTVDKSAPQLLEGERESIIGRKIHLLTLVDYIAKCEAQKPTAPSGSSRSRHRTKRT